MKSIIPVIFLVFTVACCFAQDGTVKNNRYSLGIQYNQEFVSGGYVRVREWDLPGDKMNLKDLGMSNYAVMQLSITRRLHKDRAITFLYDQYFMRGSSTFDRDIVYNGTIINGRKGINVSPTRYYRVSFIYSDILLNRTRFHLNYVGSLVFDHIVFYLDGEVTAASPKNEVYEGFGRQALPYPVIGVKGKYDIDRNDAFNFEVSGTYIPKFKSFYTEGGNMYLQYSNFLTDINYSKTFSRFEVALGGNLRHMKLFQESKEDTNVLRTLTAGPYLKAVYHF